MSDDFIVTPSEENPDDVIGQIVTNGDTAPYRCEICLSPLSYGGRGRPPTRCDEHRRQKAKTNAPKSPSGSMRGVEEGLRELYTFIGMGVSMVDPIDGMTIASQADKLAHSWILAAESNPKLKKTLIKLTQGSGIGAVVIAHAMVAYPILEHHNLLPRLLSKAEAAT